MNRFNFSSPFVFQVRRGSGILERPVCIAVYWNGHTRLGKKIYAIKLLTITIH